jgi:zinc transport system substrate-binding protein
MNGKMNVLRTVVSGSIGCCLLVLGCWCARPVPAELAGLQLFVSVPPQKYIVEKICGPYGSVSTLIPPGASPHTFEPKPAQMARLAGARCYFTVGIDMEAAWLPKIRSVNPGLRVVATDSGIVKRSMEEDAEGGHDDHHHEGDDPHIWLSPDLVKMQARRVAEALMQCDTVHTAVYRERLAMFEVEIDSLKARIAGQLERCGAAKSFLVFHPSWGYFADAFSLRQIAIEVEGKEPGIRRLGGIVGRAKREGIRAVLVQPQFSKKIAAAVAAELGGTTLVADPMAEDWAANLERVAGVLCGQ